MHAIETQTPTETFAACWAAAGRHIQHQAQGALRGWLKASLTPPFLEHLSFRLGNQLFFVRIVGEDGKLDSPGSLAGLQRIAAGCNGHACLMPMRQTTDGWSPAAPGWGLVSAQDGVRIDPPALITDAPVVMTDWELQDFAVQMVRDRLAKEGRRIVSSQSDPAVDPAIWMASNDGLEWVVVRTARYPEAPPPPPANLADIARSCAPAGRIGHFAAVAVASDQDSFLPDAPRAPLLRGHGLIVRYGGLTPVATG